MSSPKISVDNVLRRSFSTDIPSHFRLGRFGRGWSDNWDRSLTIASRRHGNHYRPRRLAARVPAGQPLRRPLLRSSGRLRHAHTHWRQHVHAPETDGTLYAFRADGKLDYVQDTHTNRIACTYAGNLLTRLTHFAGPP